SEIETIRVPKSIAPHLGPVRVRVAVIERIIGWASSISIDAQHLSGKRVNIERVKSVRIGSVKVRAITERHVEFFIGSEPQPSDAVTWRIRTNTVCCNVKIRTRRIQSIPTHASEQHHLACLACRVPHYRHAHK